MCLIIIAYQIHPLYPLILLANRDEFFDRPTAPLGFWADHPDILAGRDLVESGTWMGVTRTGRVAAITNYRDPNAHKQNAPSRGHLVADYLQDEMTPERYLQAIRRRADHYNGFTLLVGNTNELRYFSNRGPNIGLLKPGIHGLSNHLLDTPWPKVRQGKRALAEMLRDCDTPSESMCFQLLQQQAVAPDNQLPQTGVALSWERMLSPIFITSETYGTRSSSVLFFHADGHLRFSERTWVHAQKTPKARFTRHFELNRIGG